MFPKGIIGGLMVLIALGLVLRFGRSSNALLNSSIGGINSLVNSLSLAKWEGNTP